MNEPTHHEKAVRSLNNLQKFRGPGIPEPFIRLYYPNTEFDQVKLLVQHQDEKMGARIWELILFADGGWRLVV